MAKNDVSMREMLQAGVHFGHMRRFRNPKMNRYVYGLQNKIQIINLDKTLPLFQEACNVVKDLASKGGNILFVGTKRSARTIISEQAKRCSMPYINYRWPGGALTNYKTIKQSIRKLREYEKMRDDGTLEHLTKKEGLQVRRKLDKLERSLGGIKDMAGLPDALVVIDVGQEHIAITEAKRLGIPVIGVVDTNCSPENITYPIPGNDDSMKAIQLYIKTFADIVIDVHENQKKVMSSKFGDEYVEVKPEESDSTEEKPSTEQTVDVASNDTAAGSNSVDTSEK